MTWSRRLKTVERTAASQKKVCACVRVCVCVCVRARQIEWIPPLMSFYMSIFFSLVFLVLSAYLRLRHFNTPTRLHPHTTRYVQRVVVYVCVT